MMAFAIKSFIVLMVVWTTNLALMCPDSCRCRDRTAFCDICPYKTIVVKNVSAVVNMCCEAVNKNMITLIKLDPNATYTNVTITNEHTCDLSNFTLKIPSLKTETMVLRNNSLRNFNVMVNGTELKNLDLSHNNIKYLPDNAFHKFVNLISLNLNMNELNNVSGDSFLGLTNLQYLDLSNNNLTTLANIVFPMKNLQYLNLSRNNLEYLTESSFDNGLLQHLDLSYNRLSRIAPGALQFLPNLARLILSDNPSLGTSRLDGQLLLGTGRRLQQVDASRTGLYQIPEAFTHSVRFLSLAGNKISSIHGGDLDSYPLLQSLDFTDNQINTVEEDSFGRLEMLLFLNLNTNLLVTVPKMLPDELKYLSMNNNSIKNLTIPDFNNLPKLRILLLQNNGIAFIQENVFAPLGSLEVLDLSSNPIQILTPSTFNGPLSLRDLRLCYLNVSLPERDVTFPVPSPEGLQMLHLQSSPGLARQLLADSAVLAALSHLQYLDLRMNHLTEVRSDLIFYLSQLRTLRLYGNNLNCSSVDWLREWMPGDSTQKNESCYFSVANDNDDENRYNCSFSESFTINDSLPPVSLYSTEMINKLLSFYGYLNNTSELNVHRNSYKSRINKTTEATNEIEDSLTQIPLTRDTIHIKYKPSIKTSNEIIQNPISTNEMELIKDNRFKTYTNDMPAGTKTKLKTIKSNIQIGILDHKSDQDYSMLKPRSSPLYPSAMQNKPIENISTNIKYGHIKKTGKTVNKAINRKYTNSTDTDYFLKPKVSEIKDTNSQILKISALSLLNSTETYDEATLLDIGKSSPYQAKTRNYASYIGVFAVVSLIAICLVLWASLRYRYRQRRRRTSEEQDNEDHIEVASISGGVLW